MGDTTIFICNRNRDNREEFAKVQLEIPRRVLEAYKEKATKTKYTAKEIMENMLCNWIDGVAST